MSMAREKLPPQQEEKLTTAPRHSLHSSKPPPNDRHTKYARLLAAAERAPETLERLLAVTRLGISLSVDMLRISDNAGDVSPFVLGFHRLSTRKLTSAPDDRQGGESLRYQLQEICAYDTATQFVAPASATSAGELAFLRLRIAPRTAYKSGGLLSKGLTNVQVDLVGSAVVRLASHAEEYYMQLPGIVLDSPLSAACRPNLTGTLSVQCAATGLAASIRFLSGRRVDGSLNRLQGQGSAIVARIAGSWDSSIDVDVPEWNAEGTLYDADEPNVPVCSALNLRILQPMLTPYVWKSIQDALFSTSTKQAGSSKKSDALSQQLMDYLRGLDGPILNIPPCIEVERAAGKSLRYELQYLITRPLPSE